MPDNERNKYGSSKWAARAQLKRAGYFSASHNAIFLGFYEPSWKLRLNWNGPSGMLICAGPRAGKFTGIGGYNALPGFSQNTEVVLDIKGEWEEVSKDQTPDDRKVACWSPFERPGVTSSSINPAGHIKAGDKKMISFIKKFMASSIPQTGGNNSKFFELSAQDYGECIAIPITERDGEFTIPAFFDAINMLLQDTPEAHKLEWLMKSSPHKHVVAAAEAIRQGKNSSNNAFLSIMAELKNAFSCMSDPSLRASVSPPFDITLEDIVCDGKWRLYLMPDSGLIETWSPVIRAFYETLKEIKERNPQAPDMDWWLDECHLLAPFPLIAKMLNFGAGIGIRPIIIVQSFAQLDDICPNGSTIIPAGCGVQIYFRIREIESAERISRMLGNQTLRYNDTLARDEAKLKRKKLIDGLFSNGDPIALGRELNHFKKASQHRSEMERPLMTASEIMRLPAGKAIMFGDGLPHPALLTMIPYYERRELAGRFFPHHKYADDMTKVRVKTRWGHTYLNVISTTVPDKYRQFPQYKAQPYLCIEA